MTNAKDKGAHFYRCDFQVHTPRDARWSGKAAATSSERKSYAAELIQACRSKGIDAIAITDHHDFVFFPFVRAAAAEEVDEGGDLISKQNQLIVFPGVELTLSSPPCQALILLDADFEEIRLETILTLLGIETVADAVSKLPSVESVSPTAVTSLNDLEDKLNQQKWLNGRFILLPHVSDGGYKSLFREGFEKHYKEMRCVGGYMDGSFADRAGSKKSILEGRQQNNGYQGLGVFQTSDSRSRNHDELGGHITWVKWSEPTAEALRQACLAKESRLSHSEPALPSLWIASMSVSNSKFLGRLDIDFSQQYNAIIGGRGTGKSTILEYLRWALCDQPVDSDSDIAPVQIRRKKLIDDTLQKVDGEVVVTFLLNAVVHVVRRNARTQQTLLRIGDRQFANATEEEVRNLFPVQAYSQKQLSSVGVRVEELKRFVETPIRQPLDQVRAQIKSTEIKLRGAYANLVRKREIEADVAKYNVEIESLNLQITNLRNSLKGLSEQEQKIIDRKPLIDNEAELIAGLENELVRIKGHVDNLQAEIGAVTHEGIEAAGPGQLEDLNIENKGLVEAIYAKYEERLDQLRALVAAMVDLFGEDSSKELAEAISRWIRVKDRFDAQYEAAKTSATANQQTLEQVAGIERRIAEIRRIQTGNRNTLSGIGDADSVHASLRRSWDELHREKMRQLGVQCAGFSGLSNGLIKADVSRGLDGNDLRRKFKVAFAALNIKEQKIDDLCRYVVEAEDPVSAWNAVLTEFEVLALLKVDGKILPDPLPQTPIADKCGFVTTEKARIIGGFDTAKWLDLSLTELEFNPIFTYCTNKETQEYIAFADASAGQQATALLSVLLNQNGGPLIIDQPEDDVDSKMSPEIVQQIWKAKTTRQLLFASHNANFVVNGDAELVVCCDYIRSGDQTGGRIKKSGAIDNREIKDEITAVTEGGKEAFKLRKAKYGF